METSPRPHNQRISARISSAVFIEDDQQRLLLVQQAAEYKGHRWGPPAGGMDPHEDPLTTAIREAREEIGVEVELIDLIRIQTQDRGDNSSGVGFNFRAEIISGEITPREGEIMDARFFSLGEIDQLIDDGLLYKPEYNRNAIRDWSQGRSYPLEVIQRLK
jgi:8-oxo-dGTP pyrophosphatase MutT (NUDIX family)